MAVIVTSSQSPEGQKAATQGQWLSLREKEDFCESSDVKTIYDRTTGKLTRVVIGTDMYLVPFHITV